MEEIFLGVKGHVVCLDKFTGEEIWRTRLRNANITNVYYEKDHVFAYAGGHFFCLDAHRGEIQWENNLQGLGFGICIIAGEGQNLAAIAAQQAAAAVGSGGGSGGDGGGDAG